MKPRNLIFDGIDFYEEFGLKVESFVETPPEPKIHMIEVPYGNDIDVTEVINGIVWFSNRKHEFVMNTVLGYEDELIAAFSKVMSRVHGKYGTYSLSFDPGCTYEGRLSVTSTEYTHRYAGRITIEIDASPWKDKGTQFTQMRSRGGFTYLVESGRMPSVPVFEMYYPTTVVVNGVSHEFPAGTYSSNVLALHEGYNEVSLVSLEGISQKTLGEVAAEYTTIVESEGLKLYQLACTPDTESAEDVTMTYEWKDL